MYNNRFMDTKILDSNRKTRQMGVRIFDDQLDDLDWLIVHKYHNNRTRADLFRDALDQFIDREKR